MLFRLLKKLQKKDSRQVEMEKREQGFSLYLNGANLSHRQTSHVYHHASQKPVGNISEPVPSSEPDTKERTRPSRTAGMFKWTQLKLGLESCGTPSDPDSAGGGDDSECNGETSRAKSAPSKRKSWSHSAVRLKTASGEPITVPAPGQYRFKLTRNITTKPQ